MALAPVTECVCIKWWVAYYLLGCGLMQHAIELISHKTSSMMSSGCGFRGVYTDIELPTVIIVQGLCIVVLIQ